jgi:hypothetical protein
MARKKQAPTETRESGLTTMVEKVVSTVGWLKTLGETLTDKVEKGIERQTRRVLLYALWAVLMGAGLSIFVLGILFLIIDLGGIPRGMAFTAGGLLLFLPSWVAWLLMRK